VALLSNTPDFLHSRKAGSSTAGRCHLAGVSKWVSLAAAISPSYCVCVLFSAEAAFPFSYPLDDLRLISFPGWAYQYLPFPGSPWLVRVTMCPYQADLWDHPLDYIWWPWECDNSSCSRNFTALHCQRPLWVGNTLLGRSHTGDTWDGEITSWHHRVSDPAESDPLIPRSPAWWVNDFITKHGFFGGAGVWTQALHLLGKHCTT
jgi:hypothetical protein